MYKILIFSLLICLVNSQAEADFVVDPATLSSGGVAMLCWQGEAPAEALLKVTFDDNIMPHVVRNNRPCALIGVDLEKPAGLWPLTVESVDSAGNKQLAYLSLRVEGVERAIQKLSLPKQMVTPTKPKIIKQIELDRVRLDKIFSQRQPILFSPPFSRPVSGEVISAFGLRRVLNGVPKSPHNGIDFRAGRGTPVLAMADGTVALADDLYYTGKTVVLDHGGGLFSLYAHLETFDVTQGAKVRSGKIVGTVGSTGRSTAPHLHMGTRLGKARIDPLALINIFSK